MSERVKNVEREIVLGHSSVGESWTIFVDNLSKRVSRGKLREIFHHYGQVVRIFIPKFTMKPKYTSSTFAFVQFASEEGRRRAIQSVDGTWIDGKRVTVGIEKYRKSRDGEDFEGRTKRIGSKAKRVEKTKGQNNAGSLGVIKLPFEQDFVQKALENEGFHVKIARWGYAWNACVVTFNSIEEYSGVWAQNQEDLFYWFDWMAPLMNDEGVPLAFCLVGLSLLCWNGEFLEKLVQKWGKVICIKESSKNRSDLSLARVLIRVASPFDVPESVTVGSYDRSYKVKVILGSKSDYFSGEKVGEISKFGYSDNDFFEEERSRRQSLEEVDNHKKSEGSRKGKYHKGDHVGLGLREELGLDVQAQEDDSWSSMSNMKTLCPSGSAYNLKWIGDGSKGRFIPHLNRNLNKPRNEVVEDGVDFDKVVKNVEDTEVEKEAISVEPAGIQPLEISKGLLSNGLRSWSPLDHLSRSLAIRTVPVGRWIRGNCNRVYKRTKVRKVWYNPSREEGLLQLVVLIDQNGKASNNIANTHSFPILMEEGNICVEEEGGSPPKEDVDEFKHFESVEEVQAGCLYGAGAGKQRRRRREREDFNKGSIGCGCWGFLQRGKKAFLEKVVNLEEVINIISWNIRGLGEKEKSRAVSRLGKDRGNFLKGGVFSSTNETAGGLFVLWNENEFEVSNSHISGRFIAIFGKFKTMEDECVIINVYGPSIESEKEEFFRELVEFVSTQTISICIGGDFNLYLDPAEKLGSFRRVVQRLLPRSLSDHNPVSLEESSVEWGPKPFRFFNYLLEEEGFEDLVKSTMDGLRERNKRSGIFSIIQGTKKSIRIWSSRKFNGISESIEDSKRKINELEFKAQGSNFSTQEWEQVKRHRSDLWRIYRIEESIWFQKARTRWIKDEDRNTRFFHLCALNRSRRNAITSLKINGSVVSDPILIKTHISEFFKTEYNSILTMEVEDLLLDFSKLSLDQASKLEEQFLEQEIWQAIATSDNSKSPGPDGPSQFAFIPGRQLLDCAFIANEGIDYWRKQGLQGVVLKVDFRRAYGSVEWTILIRAMKEMGFGMKWCSWISQCLSSASISVLVNGSPSDEFSMAKGLRQGCSLSPLLFNIVGELLHLMLSTAVDKGLFEGFVIGNSENSFCEDKRKIHWVNWSSVCKPMSSGGLGVLDLNLTNRALLAKWVWKFANEKNSIWKRVLCSKHKISCNSMSISKIIFEAASWDALGKEVGNNDMWSKGVWLGLSPPRVEAFLWQLAHQKMAVKVELVNRGMSLVLPKDPPLLISWGNLRVNSLIWKFIREFRLSKWFKAKYPKIPIQEDLLIGDPSLADGNLVSESKDRSVLCWLPHLLIFEDERRWSCKRISVKFPTSCELKAIKRGIEIFLASRWFSVTRLIVESDCKSAVEWVHFLALALVFLLPLVKEILSLFSKKVLLIRLIPRACNGEADSLAKMGIG
ncbi:hypothetical protein F3Y22_tig00110032pilonHSYRG00029 [Hibiscus syriacus]|uniref:RRM domain-containing protein n=1 Tax=Hibiscus syriacus TaxID=106335 RepID=A0A6A3BNR0_HIBSY|nr:hypothetical protein F3Y22_tig00110032pilonHSYRG00029 [Hibiscus syriacus]